jgi:hypothetical protein
MAKDAAAKGARMRRLEPPLRRSVHVIWREGRVSALAQHFLDFCENAGSAASAGATDDVCASGGH